MKVVITDELNRDFVFENVAKNEIPEIVKAWVENYDSTPLSEIKISFK